MKYIFLILSLFTISVSGQTLLPVPSTPTTANINSALGGAIAASGTDTYTASLTGLSTYTGFACDIQFTNANTGPATLNITGATVLGAKALKKYSSGSLVDLAAGDIQSGSRIRFYYNGTYLVMMGGGSSTSTDSTSFWKRSGWSNVTNPTISSSSNVQFYGSRFKVGSQDHPMNFDFYAPGNSSMTTEGTMSISGLGAGSTVVLTSNDNIGGESEIQVNSDKIELAGAALTIPTTNSVATKAYVDGAVTSGSTPDATSLVKGKMKLYTSTGSSTDGTMDRNSITNALASKQATLVSGTNIKTVNGGSLLGSGDIGTIDETHGGTGQTTVAQGDLLVGFGTNLWTKLNIGTSGKVLTSNGVTAVWQTPSAGTVTSVSASSPISVSNPTTTPNVTISQATTSTDGYLSQTDWNTFNGKQSTITASNGVSVTANNVTLGDINSSTSMGLNSDLSIDGPGNLEFGPNDFNINASDSVGIYSNHHITMFGTAINLLSSILNLGDPVSGYFQINGGLVTIQNNNAGIGTKITGKALGRVLTLTLPATNDDPIVEVCQGRTTTTNATPTTIFSYGSTTDNTMFLAATVICRRTGGSAGTAGDGAAYKIEGVFKNVSGTVTQIGTTTQTIYGESQAGFDATFSISGTNILVQGTGATNNNITWHVPKLEASKLNQ